VKVFVILLIALSLLVVVLHLMGIGIGGHSVSSQTLQMEFVVQQL
jgi:hypothetical protein